ncbi:MAG: AraC family transcriptional regulator, partial [Oscillospiraceae bacterium]|nr:AraC family transcriptional regulator [Oscillospiraceae bacterium]
HVKPSILSIKYHVSWILDSHRANEVPDRFFLIGPFFIDSFPESSIKQEMDMEGLSLKAKYQLLDYFRDIDSIGFTKIMNYTVMAHYAITGQKINIYDLHYPDVAPPSSNSTEDNDAVVHGTYDAEREMLRMVREGDLRIFDHLQKLGANANIGKLANSNSEPLRQMRNTLLVATTLFSRAAIEGGLYPETAMTLTDHYFQAVEAAKSFQELAEVGYTMQNDFVNRVHKIHMNSNFSDSVQTVISYIDLHLEDDIFLKNIASELGYSDYYLSKKFKTETGVTIKEYIRDERLKRAAFLLEKNTLPVNEISERLKFPSHSYFTDCFKKKFGVTPKQYQLNRNNR